nr:MAG TPA: hypothetical protein [Caudoviricetes sp.]
MPYILLFYHFQSNFFVVYSCQIRKSFLHFVIYLFIYFSFVS